MNVNLKMADSWMQCGKNVRFRNANLKNRPIHEYKYRINWNATSYEKVFIYFPCVHNSTVEIVLHDSEYDNEHRNIDLCSWSLIEDILRMENACVKHL